MDNDLKLLVENCKVRTYEEVLSDAKLQQIDNPQIKKRKRYSRKQTRKHNF